MNIKNIPGKKKRYSSAVKYYKTINTVAVTAEVIIYKRKNTHTAS